MRVTACETSLQTLYLKFVRKVLYKNILRHQDKQEKSIFSRCYGDAIVQFDNQARKNIYAKDMCTLSEYKELLKSKDAEYQIKENREIQKYKDELFSVEEDYKEQVNKLQKECYEKEKSLTSLREKYQLIETQNHNIN